MTDQTRPYKSVKCCPFCQTVPEENTYISKEFESFGAAHFSIREMIHPSFKVIRCKKCSLLYKSSIPSEDDLFFYYSHLNTDYENLDIVFPTDKIIIDYLKDFPSDNFLLDYGCGSGRLMSHLPGFNKFGVEINSEAIKNAQNKGIKIVKENELENYFKNYFDVIILTDVYEHLINPRKLFELLLGALKPGGELIIATGLFDGVRLKDRIGYYWYFQLYSHLQMLSYDHARWLSQQYHLSIKIDKKVSHYDISLAIHLKKILANILFRIYNLPMAEKFLPKIKSVQDWKYPIFDMYNKDHVVCVYKKLK